MQLITSSQAVSLVSLDTAHTRQHTEAVVPVQVLDSQLSGLHVPYSYGFSIILLTVIVKLGTFPLTSKQAGTYAQHTEDLGQEYVLPVVLGKHRSWGRQTAAPKTRCMDRS